MTNCDNVYARWNTCHSKVLQLNLAHHKKFVLFQRHIFNTGSKSLALRSGSTVANEVYPRRGYC